MDIEKERLMKEKKSHLLQTVKQMNVGVSVCGVGFLLYLAASALKLGVVVEVIGVVFGVIALYVFFSVAVGRGKDKESVSYNLLWGSASLAILLLGFAAAGI